MAEIQWREPERFAAGDTLWYERFLPDYLPSNGWSIHAVLTNKATGIKALDFYSQPGTDEASHEFSVVNFGAGLTLGDYILSEYVVNTPVPPAAQWRHQIYFGDFKLMADLADGLAPASLLTFEQQMVTALRTKLLRLETYDLTETDVQRSRFVVEERGKTQQRLLFWEERLNYAMKKEVIRNTGRNPDVIAPLWGGRW